MLELSQQQWGLGGSQNIFGSSAWKCVEVRSELSTGRMDPRVGSGRVGSGHDFAGCWRVGSGRVSTSGF